MASSHIRPNGGLSDGKWAVWAAAGFFLLMLAIRISDIFAGTIPGADDMMRLQQIRDLLGGQGWFNVDQARLLTPEGGDMHWSRLPDLFVSGVILITEPFIGQDAAEKLAIGTWPLVLLAAAFTFLTQILKRLGVNRAGQFFALIFFATSAAIYNFWPGRIDHHGFVVTLSLGGFAAALSPRLSPRSGLILGLCVTAMLTIALEALPYVAGLIAIMGLFWVVRGHREGVRLAVFGLSLSVFASLFYVFDAPGAGPQRFVCDAYGTSHLVGLVVGGGLLTLLGVFGGALDTWPKRLIAGAVAGALTLALVTLVNPSCLGDPYATVSDSVRLSWLNMVGEAKPLSTLLVEEPGRVVWVFGFIAAASLATGLMVFKARPEQRLARIALALLFGLSILTTVWQIRGQSFSHLFAAIGAGWLTGAAFMHWRTKSGPKLLLGFVAVLALASPVSWEKLAMHFPSKLAPSQNLNCISPEAYIALAERAEMRIHTPVILGVSVLARTPHAVFAGPYHRNIAGVERAHAVLIGPADEAHERLLELGATHLLYCKGLRETTRLGETWPDGLAARLNRDEVPDWLIPDDGLSETDGVVRVYRVTAR